MRAQAFFSSSALQETNSETSGWSASRITIFAARRVFEPYLKSIPSVWASLRIESIESPTELMKQAEHCGCSSTPTLNQTGELKLIFCRSSRWESSASKVAASASEAK